MMNPANSPNADLTKQVRNSARCCPKVIVLSLNRSSSRGSGIRSFGYAEAVALAHKHSILAALPARRNKSPDGGDSSGLCDSATDGLAATRGSAREENDTIEMWTKPRGDAIACLPRFRIEWVPRQAMKILVVDDEKIKRVTLADDLATQGHEVVVAADGEEALKSSPPAGSTSW